MNTEISKKVQFALENLPDTTCHQEFLSIPLDCLQESIRPNILIRLAGIGVHTVQALIDMIMVDFIHLKGLWSQHADELVHFRAKVVSEPQSILDIYKASLPAKFPTKGNSNNFLKVFMNILEDYFGTQPNRELEIFTKRFSLDGASRKTLQEIGDDFKVSRERARQIISSHLSSIRQLINGEVAVLRKNNYVCSEESVSLFHKIKMVLLSKQYFLREEFLSYLKLEGIEIEYQKSDEPYLMLFLEAICPQIYEFNSSFVLIACDKDLTGNVIPDLNILSDKIRNVLNKYPVLMTDEVLYKKLKRTFQDLDFEFLKFCCDSDETIEIIKTEIGRSYQLKLEHLRSINSCIYRILYNKKKPMHASEIYLLLSLSYEFKNSNMSMPHAAVSNRMHLDKRFKSVGKTGVWGLSSWNYNTQSIYDLILDTLKEANDPISFKDLYKIILKKRKDIKYTSTLCIIGQHKETFAYTEGHLLILKSWDKYPVIEFNREKMVPGPKIDVALTSVFAKNKKLNSEKICSLLKKEGIKLNRRGINSRLNRSPMVQKETLDGQNYYSLIEGASPRITEPLKQDLMIQSAKNLIFNSPVKKLKLSEVVHTLEEKFKFHKYSLYSVINEENGFLKETVGPKEVLVSVKDFS